MIGSDFFSLSALQLEFEHCNYPKYLDINSLSLTFTTLWDNYVPPPLGEDILFLVQIPSVAASAKPLIRTLSPY